MGVNVRAIQFLQERLKNGPVLAKTMHADGMEHGFKRTTLLRAGRHIGLEFEREEGARLGEGGWVWKLPDASPEFEPVERDPVEVNGKLIYPDRQYRLKSGRVISGATYISMKNR